MDLRPMLATPSTGARNRVPIDIESLRDTHAFDVKLDGIRAFAHWDGHDLRLTNRNQVDITAKYPELIAAAQGLGSRPMVLDGEIMADDGRFESVLTRDKQSNAIAIARAAAASPVRFFAFDVPNLGPLTWEQRREILEATPLPDRFGRTVLSRDPAFLSQTAQLGLEGVIAKRIDSTYQFGARSRSWVKFKNLHHVTCLVSGYATGTGSRAHFGAMFLTLLDEAGDPVPCGRVGTGFNARDIADLKERLDRKETLVVEIECLGVTSGQTLRMPVYRGIRTDVDTSACSVEQLSALPKS